MLYPAIQLHQLYSINLSDDIHIILEDLHMVNHNELKNIIQSKQFELISVVKDSLYINTATQTISIVGYKINSSTYLLTKEGTGTTIHLPYTCTKETIQLAVECLYHLHQNWTNEQK